MSIQKIVVASAALLLSLSILSGCSLAGAKTGAKYRRSEKYISGNEQLYDIALEHILDTENSNQDNLGYGMEGYHFFASYEGLGITADDSYTYAYMWVLGEGCFIEDHTVKSGSGFSMFYKFTFDGENIIKYENPEDGSEYVPSVEKMCIDKDMRNKIVDHQLSFDNSRQIKEYYSSLGADQ